MAKGFKSYRSYWDFANAVRNETRYLFGKETNDFLKSVAATCRSREFVLSNETSLYRAQLDHQIEPEYAWDESSNTEVCVSECFVPSAESRLRPLTDRAMEGRANSKGFPVFYSATDKDTSIAEVRPWVGSFVSYGRFCVKKDLRLVNCAGNSMGQMKLADAIRFHEKEPDAKVREGWVWHHIDHAFSEPVGRSDVQADYVPTQILAELFRRESFDGMMFQSSVGTGMNIVLFDLASVTLQSKGIVRINKLQMEFEEPDDARFR